MTATATEATVDSAKRYLQMVDGVRRSGQPDFTGHTPESFVLKYGREWAVTTNTYKGRRAKRGMCYMNAGRKALFEDECLTYVEGFVMVHGVALQHAWLVNAAGEVVDPTLKNDVEHAYFGVPFKTEYLEVTVFSKGTWGIIDGMTNRELLTNTPPEAEFLAQVG